ncbi:hypothetical protein HK102_003015, partial [Quaeritorhiza haematococci]
MSSWVCDLGNLNNAIPLGFSAYSRDPSTGRVRCLADPSGRECDRWAFRSECETEKNSAGRGVIVCGEDERSVAGGFFFRTPAEWCKRMDILLPALPPVTPPPPSGGNGGGGGGGGEGSPTGTAGGGTAGAGAPPGTNPQPPPAPPPNAESSNTPPPSTPNDQNPSLISPSPTSAPNAESTIAGIAVPAGQVNPVSRVTSNTNTNTNNGTSSSNPSASNANANGSGGSGAGNSSSGAIAAAVVSTCAFIVLLSVVLTRHFLKRRRKKQLDQRIRSTAPWSFHNSNSSIKSSSPSSPSLSVGGLASPISPLPTVLGNNNNLNGTFTISITPTTGDDTSSIDSRPRRLAKKEARYQNLVLAAVGLADVSLPSSRRTSVGSGSVDLGET